MKFYPIDGYASEPTQKQFWIMAFTSALCRVPPAEAMREADESLRLAEERWTDAPAVACWEYRHSFPLGHQFDDEKSPATPGPLPSSLGDSSGR